MAKGLRLTPEQYAHLTQRKPMAGVDIDKVHRAKFGNVKVDGFDSKKEARRYEDLLTLERAGKIAGLARQVPFACVVNGIHVCDYVADFTYVDGARKVVEDVKSDATRKLPVYRLKRKLVLACHGIQISET